MLFDEQAKLVLLHNKRLSARFGRVAKAAARYRIMRIWVERGVRPTHMPSIERVQIQVDKLDELRANFFRDAVKVDDRLAMVAVPFWWRRRAKGVDTYEQSCALIGIDIVDATFVLPPPEYIDIFDTSDYDLEDVDEESANILAYLRKDEREKENDETRKDFPIGVDR